jgi:hypothetical protein
MRWKLCLAIMAATSASVFSGSAAAQELNCDNFDSQAEAQDFLRENPSDPEGLDGPPGAPSTGIRGVACEENPPPTDFDPVLPSGIGVPNGVAEGEPPDSVLPDAEPPDSGPPDDGPPNDGPPDREPPDRELPDRQPPDREPPDDEDEKLLDAGGDLPLPQQSTADNASDSADSRFPLWRVAGMILSASVFVWAGYRIFSRG